MAQWSDSSIANNVGSAVMGSKLLFVTIEIEEYNHAYFPQ